ncbi:MAG: hypothetical protein QW255_04110 [Candidatus Bilamarchaeaceae archaeon]
MDNKVSEKKEIKQRKFQKFKDALKNISNKLIQKTKKITAGVLILGMLLPATLKANEETALRAAPPIIADNKLSYGVNYYNNDAGSSLSGELSFYDWLSVRGGGIWLNNIPYGIGSINVTPSLRLIDGHLNLYYNGNITFTHMASWFYTVQGAGASTHFSIGKVSFNLATLGQGAISYPTYDMLFARWVNGFLVDYNNKLELKIINTNYFAASKTPNTALVVDYRPRYEGNIFEINYKNENLGIFGLRVNTDKIDPDIGIAYGREVYNEGGVSVLVSLGGGVRGYNPIYDKEFFPHTFYVGGIVTVNFGNSKKERPDNYYTMEFENKNMLTNPNYEKRFIAENGQITPQEEQWINNAKTNIENSNYFGDLILAYNGKSTEELLTVANYLASVLGRGGYDYGAYNDLKEFKIFSPNVKNLTSKNYDDILYFIKEYNRYYAEHGTYDGMPEELKNGVAICAGIHEFIAEFLRANGIQAYTITVNTKKSPHVVALAFYEENGDKRVSIIDYGMRYTAKSGSLDDALKIYSQVSGVPILQTQIFGRGGKYYGTYITQQGKLVQKAMGVDAQDLINNMLKNWSIKSKNKTVAQEYSIDITPDDFINQPHSVEQESSAENKEEKNDGKKEFEMVIPKLNLTEPSIIKEERKEDRKEMAVIITPQEKEEKKTPQSQLKNLYQAINDKTKYLGERYKLKGKIVVLFEVNEKEGKVIDVKVKEDSTSPSVHTDKVLDELKRIEFKPNPNGKEKSEFEYSLNFGQ